MQGLGRKILSSSAPRGRQCPFRPPEGQSSPNFLPSQLFWHPPADPHSQVEQKALRDNFLLFSSFTPEPSPVSCSHPAAEQKPAPKHFPLQTVLSASKFLFNTSRLQTKGFKNQYLVISSNFSCPGSFAIFNLFPE